MDNVYKGCPAKMEDARFLTDYRSADTRELYTKSINGFVRDDEYRMFLQNNADVILDKEWDFLTEKNLCRNKVCVHTLPTRATHGSNTTELHLYNSVTSGKIKQEDDKFPRCEKYPDYRLSHTNKSTY